MHRFLLIVAVVAMVTGAVPVSAAGGGFECDGLAATIVGDQVMSVASEEVVVPVIPEGNIAGIAVQDTGSAQAKVGRTREDPNPFA